MANRRRRLRPGPHNCIEVIDRALVEKGVRLSVRVVDVEDPRPRVMVEDLEEGSGRSASVNMLAIFCPFCGTPLQ